MQQRQPAPLCRSSLALFLSCTLPSRLVKVLQMDAPERVEAKKTLLAYLYSQGLRCTSQREAIIAAAMSTTDHFTAEDLHEMARKIESSVSRATVYRTLPLLVSSGMLRELDLGGGMKCYDPNFIEHPTHNHLICIDCGKIIEFEDPNMELLENCISRRLGFSPTNKSIKIEARCDRLKMEGSCPNLVAVGA